MRAAAAVAGLVGACLVIGACTGSGPASPASSPSAAASASSSASSSQPAPSASAPAATGTAPAPTTLPQGAWTELATGASTPDPREDHTWTVDADGATAYLFGGRDGGTVFADLWAYDLASNAWREIAVSGDAPAGRFGHEAAWIPGSGLAIFAGQTGSTFFNDLWLFDPGAGAWSKLLATGNVPIPRYGSCSGVGPDGRLWISHGFTEDGVRFADTHAYDFAKGAWSDVLPSGDGPIERCLHACWWTSQGTFQLYGGQTTGVAALGDLWTLTPGAGTPASWAEASGALPPARQLPAVARHASTTVVVGGRGIDRAPLADAWVLPDATGAFAPLPVSGSAPPARSGAALIDDAVRDRMLLFGGLGDGSAFADTWSLSWR
jgi:hypothetical protein